MIYPLYHRTMQKPFLCAMVIFLICTGCKKTALNNPYPANEETQNILYSSFSERPKHLDPALSYSSNEIVFTAQIYEPPFQYHYLKRPYTLVPLTAEIVPKPIYLDANNQPLGDSAPDHYVAFSLYEITIKPNIRYQPHPAFAQDQQGRYVYHSMTGEQIEKVNRISDFQETGSRELTAADYIYEIKRLVHPNHNSPIAGFMGEYIVGLKDLSAALQREKQALEKLPAPSRFLDLRSFSLSGVEAVDRYTYRIKIVGKYPQFIYWLAMPFFAPVPWEADAFYAQQGLIDKNITLDWYPIGTGPYRLTVNNPNRQMVLEKNPNFHGENYPSDGGSAEDQAAGLHQNAGEPLPFIDKAVYSLEKENIPIWNKFLQGYYDASGIGSDSFDQAIRIGSAGHADLSDEMKAKGMRLITDTSPTTYYLGFNMLDPVVGGLSTSTRKLRQAIAIAMDQEEAIAIFQNGRGVPMQGPIPPGIFGYQDGENGVHSGVYDWIKDRPQRKSIQEAKTILAEAGYPFGKNAKSGNPLILYFDTAGGGPDDKAHFDWLLKQFAKIDLQLVIRNTDYNRFQDKMQKGTAQMFQWGWHADYPDPENFLFLLYGKNAKVGHGGENASNYASPEFDGLFDQMRNMENGPERQAVIDKMVEIFERDIPWATGFHPQVFGLYHVWYGQTKPNHIAYNTLKYVQIDPEARAIRRAQWNRPVFWPAFVLAGVLVTGMVPAIVLRRRRERKILR